MAYMMKTRGWTAVQTMRQFRANRDVRPNDGFMRYIVELDNREVSLKAHSQYLELKAIKIQKSKIMLAKSDLYRLRKRREGFTSTD